METNHELVRAVYAAKEDNQKADELICRYIPYIRAEASKFMSRLCTEQDDEYSIAMIAFHEAILAYSWERGAFLPYAATLIRNRLIDEYRKEKRHQGKVSLDAAEDEDGLTLMDQVADSRDHYAESQNLEATQQEIAELDDDEKAMFLEDLGLSESGLEKLIKASYRLLGLISYLTSGEDETRAWTIERGTKAPQAAGKIHSDFERGFIRAEVVSYEKLVECGSFNAAKEKGLIRSEGKEYVFQDGDVVLFRFNV